jgi:hypothetical protein
MEVIKVPGYQVQAPAKKPKHAFAVQTPEDGISLHQLGLIVGRKGGGKGYALFSLLRQLKKEGFADRIWVLSPTCQSNKDLYQSAGVREQGMIVDATNNAYMLSTLMGTWTTMLHGTWGGVITNAVVAHTAVSLMSVGALHNNVGLKKKKRN